MNPEYFIIGAILIIVTLYLGLCISRNEIDIFDLQADVKELKKQLRFLKTRGDGRFLAVQLAVQQGLDYEEAEERSEYTEDCKVVIPGKVYELEEARNELNRLIAEKHNGKCFELTDREEDVIMEMRYGPNKTLTRLIKKNKTTKPPKKGEKK